MPWEFDGFNNCKTLEQFGKYVLDFNKTGFNSGDNAVYQATTQFILKSWVKRIKTIEQEFIDKYVNNGGKYILKI